MNDDDACEWGPSASREEWIPMYIRGLSLRQISRLCRLKYAKVRFHIRTQERHDPTLFGRRLLLHDQPALPPESWRPAAVRPSWDDRYIELCDLITRMGRFPQQLSGDPAERRLYKWIRWQHTRHTHGRLTPDQANRLDQLGNWQGNLLGNRETHWCAIHAQLLQFIQDTGLMPHRDTEDATALEATLDVWIQTQRAKARAGKLTPTRRHTLDQTVPSWNTTPRCARDDKHTLIFAAVLRIMRPRFTASTGQLPGTTGTAMMPRRSHRSLISSHIPAAGAALRVEHCCVGGKQSSLPAGKNNGKGQEDNHQNQGARAGDRSVFPCSVFL